MFHQFNNQIPVIISMGVKPSSFGFDILCATFERTQRKSFGFFSREVTTKIDCYFHLEKRVWLEMETNTELKPVEQVELTLTAIKANAGKYMEK